MTAGAGAGRASAAGAGSGSSVDESSLDKYILTLFVTGQGPRSEQAISNLRRICEQLLRGRCEMTVVDVLERPQLAEEARILATPTLVRRQPLPDRRIIGDLSDTEQVMLGLGLPRATMPRPDGVA